MTSYFQIIAALLLVILIIYFRATNKTSQSLNHEILIWGLPSSHKTRLFYKLLSNKLVDSITSSSINQETFQLGTEVYTLIDFPGHSSFDREVKSALKQNSPVVFLIDANEK